MSSYTKNKLEYLKGTKQLIREAIEEKGQTVTDGDSFRSYVDKIANIKTGVDVSGVTATAPHVLEGDVFVDADGNPVNGTMKNNGAVLKKLRYSGYDEKYTYTIPEGYHDGTGIVEVRCDSEQIVYPSKYRQRLYGTPIRDNDWNLTGYNFLGHVVIDPIPDQYQDVTPVTATAEDVRAGKIIVDAQGNEVVGTLVVEQKAPDVIWVGKDSVSNALVGTGVIRYVTFCNHDGTVTYGQKSVIAGENCVDPVTAGHMETPTRESTAQYNYTFSGGWATEPNGGKDSNALKNVTEDRTVYANFIAAVRYYTVSFYDGETLVHTESVPYGGSSTYQHIKGDYIFQGWTPEPTNITGDLACYGSWIESVDFADASWETIIRVSESGMASTLFKIGDQKQLTCTAPNGVTQTVTMQIVGFDQDTLKDGTKAGITLLSLPPSEENWMRMDETNKAYSWNYSNLYKNLYSVTVPSFPEDLRNGIKYVKKITRKWVDGTDGTGQDSLTPRIWIPSLGEFDITKDMFGKNVYPEDDGIKYTYDYKTLWDNRNVWFRSGNYASSNQVYAWAAARVQSESAMASNDVVFGFCI